MAALALATRYGSLDDAALTERWADDGETLDVSRALHRCSGAARSALLALVAVDEVMVLCGAELALGPFEVRSAVRVRARLHHPPAARGTCQLASGASRLASGVIAAKEAAL